MKITPDEITQAYNWLKREIYYDTINLFLRNKIADFEFGDIETKLEGIRRIFNSINSEKDIEFVNILNKIDFKILPKIVKKGKLAPIDINNNLKIEKVFLSNLRTSKQYDVESINYFIDAPIEVYLLSILWCVKIGRILDTKLHSNCMGYRINIENDNKNPYTLFRYYLPQYNKWRDQAISIGINNLENENDILLMALDIKDCFYNLECDWLSIDEVISNNITNSSELNDSLLINKLLESIHSIFYQKIKKAILKTHYKESSNITQYAESVYPKSVLPIGLPSSSVIANWELSRLDDSIQGRLRPIYYGRYVDDILLVINNPKKEIMESEDVKSIVKEYFVNTGIFEDFPLTSKKTDHQNDQKELLFYKFSGFKFLFLQSGKLILHYYDHASSWAGLTKFKNELQKQSSEFRFLPEDFSGRELTDDAYDIEFEGSINKLRNVIGVKENSNKLVSYLYNQQLKVWLTHNTVDRRTIDQLERYFQGENILNNFKVWDRIFSLFIGSKNYSDHKKICDDISNTISLLEYSKDNKLEQKLKTDLNQYLDIAISLSIALLDDISREKIVTQKISLIADKFRKSKLIRHQYVRWPLVEYLEEKINLLDLNSLQFPVDIKNINFKYAPRFIHFEEFQLLLLDLSGDKVNDYDNFTFGVEPSTVKTIYLDKFVKENKLSPEFIDNALDYRELKYSSKISENDVNWEYSDQFIQDAKIGKLDINSKVNSKKYRHDNFIIGISNINIPFEHIKSNIVPPQKSKVGIDFQNGIFHLLNEAMIRPECDLIVFPEVCIPFHFIPFMANQSRRKNVGLVFGVEHKVVNNICYNLVVTILPFENESGYQSCCITIRNKNYYAPEEEKNILDLGIELPNNQDNFYYYYSWRGCKFSIYNCFELTDIVNRGIFRSKVDLIIGVSWNKDINYYSSLLDSASRDIHCYVANINTSQFGDSKIIAPKRTEEKNIINISGGENCVLLKGKIDIDMLRDFQKKNFDSQDKRFKPTPAGFDHEYVRKNRL